jgi:hypothetical protein
VITWPFFKWSVSAKAVHAKPMQIVQNIQILSFMVLPERPRTFHAQSSLLDPRARRHRLAAFLAVEENRHY